MERKNIPKYNPHKIEEKWQNTWPLERESYKLNEVDQKYYCLDMFSYPSSEGLHMGHWRPFTIADVWSRYQTLLGKKVLHPVGFDAFGLPAENAAIKTGTHPAEYTKKSIVNFTRQLKQMGVMYDWSTLINTSDPEYYKWTQWLFLQLYKNGLAYRKSALVNWCPKDQTVLANEQVVNGACERCGTTVIKKELKQWFFKITDFAEELLDFSTIDWPERVKHSQINWIGKSEGAQIDFAVKGREETIAVFTTRPDTLFGVTYLVIAPEYTLLNTLVTSDNKAIVDAYIQKASKKTEIDRLSEDKQKTGIFTGSYAIHPITHKKIPIWVADYVISTYGTGAVMGVPAHDARDFVFATDYNLPIEFVIKPEDDAIVLDTSQAYIKKGILINSGEFSGRNSEEAKLLITQAAQGKPKTHYRLRDWLVSRQRAWGPPIPIIYCDSCGEQPVPESDLPVLLPENMEFMPSGTSPLDRHPAFKYTTCPKCSGKAVRETDTSDTFVDSSWYFLRYTSPHNPNTAFDAEQVEKWLPVDFYIGGVEHSILHLLYARFIMKALNRLHLVPYNEPFKLFYGNGMVYLHGSKMSKSKGNVVNPDEMVKLHGTDAMRGYILFMGPADQDVEWQTGGINGIRRFLERSWQTFLAYDPSLKTEIIAKPIERAYGQLNELLPQFHFNRSISTLMTLINELDGHVLCKNEVEVITRLYAPFFPHFAEEIWSYLGNKTSIFESRWPVITVEPDTSITYVVQVNGKVKGSFEYDRTADEELVVAEAKNHIDRTLFSEKNIVKTIFVPGRIVNFVVK
jgi:leucyl-tRNA synthetase